MPVGLALLNCYSILWWRWLTALCLSFPCPTRFPCPVPPLPFLLPQAASITSQHAADAAAAEGVLSSLSAGFELEEATSRRSTAAPPSQYLMAGKGHQQTPY